MESIEEFKVFAREKYKDFDRDEEWLDYIYSYSLEYNPVFTESLCLGTPGIYCIHQDDKNADCGQCLLEDINVIKDWFGITE